MYKIFVGKISAQRKKNWFCRDENPYAVWEAEALAEQICTGGAWATADEMLRDHVDVDWGSIAWKAKKEEIIAFFKVCRLDTSDLQTLDEKEEYAVVFLETVWGDSP